MASNYLVYWLMGFWESSPPALNVVYIVGTSMIAFGLISLAMGKGRGTPPGTITVESQAQEPTI